MDKCPKCGRRLGPDDTLTTVEYDGRTAGPFCGKCFERAGRHAIARAHEQAKGGDRAMPAFKAIVEKPGIKYVDEKDGGVVLGCDPVAIITFIAEAGNPHELADEISKLRGKRVSVQVTLEQPEFELGAEDEAQPELAAVGE